MSIWRKLFKPTPDLRNLLESCHPIIKDMIDEQERIFEGMIQFFCEDNQIHFRGVEDTYLFKARLTAGVMIPFCYAHRGKDERGYKALMNLAFNMSYYNRIGRELFPEPVALLIGEKFISQQMRLMAEEHKAGTAAQRFSQILADLLVSCSQEMYSKTYPVERYGHLITTNISAQFNRASSIFR